MTKTSLVLDQTTVDYIDGTAAQAVVTNNEAAIADARAYYISVFNAALGAGLDQEVLIRTAATETSLTSIGTATGPSLVEFFENTTVSDDGTPVPTFNRNRVSPQASAAEVFVGPTVTDDGDSLGQYLIVGGGGGGQSSSPIGTAEFPLEWILPPGQYLMRVTNQDVGDISSSVFADFFERF